MNVRLSNDASAHDRSSALPASAPVRADRSVSHLDSRISGHSIHVERSASAWQALSS